MYFSTLLRVSRCCLFPFSLLRSMVIPQPGTLTVFEAHPVAPGMVNLRDELVFQLRDFRITLRQYGIEVLYGPLPHVVADPERVERFFRTAIGRMVQFSRGGSQVVHVEAKPRERGLDLVFTARKSGQEHLLVVGHFPEYSFSKG